MMFELLASIHRSALLLMSFLSNLEWNRRSNCPYSDLKASISHMIEAEDKEDMTYNQQYLMFTSKRRRAYRCPPRATQSSKTMSIWTLSNYFRRFLMDFLFGGFGIVAKDPIVEVIIPELTRLEFLAEVIWVWLRKRLQPKILRRLRDSNCVLLSQGSDVEYKGTGGSLEMSWGTRWRVSI